MTSEAATTGFDVILDPPVAVSEGTYLGFKSAEVSRTPKCEYRHGEYRHLNKRLEVSRDQGWAGKTSYPVLPTLTQ